VSATLALSVGELTVAAAWISGLAVFALVVLGWRQPARTRLRRPRGPRPDPAYELSDGLHGIPVEQRPTEEYRRPGPLRRLLALGTTGVVAVVTGAVFAIALSFLAVYAVTTLTSLLRQ
jgi:hypothetical protein